MAKAGNSTAGTARKLPLLLAAAGLSFGLPSASLAYVAFSSGADAARLSAFEIFTPATVEPGLARRVAERADGSGIRFTPAGAAGKRDRTVTVAVRVDGDTARAISIRSAIETAPGTGSSIAALNATRYNLGTARGYKSFGLEDLK